MLKTTTTIVTPMVSRTPMTMTQRIPATSWAISIVSWKFSAVAECARMNGPRSLSTRYAMSAGTKLKKMPPMWTSVAHSFSSSGRMGCAGW